MNRFLSIKLYRLKRMNSYYRNDVEFNWKNFDRVFGIDKLKQSNKKVEELDAKQYVKQKLECSTTSKSDKQLNNICKETTSAPEIDFKSTVSTLRKIGIQF